MNFNKYIIKKENQYDYFDVFSCVKDFIHINNYYHLSCDKITEKIFIEISQKFPDVFHKSFFKGAIKKYMNDNKELFIIIGEQNI